MIALLFVLTMQAATPDIVVSGKRLAEAYESCVEQGCPPLRDAQVSIAFAEQQFRQGAYQKARYTLAAAVARNKDNAAAAPKPVAALYEAYATVSLHDGEMDVFKKAVGGQVRTLRDNLPPNDPAVTAAAFATGDMWVSLGNGRAAESSYRAVERQALASGDATLAMLATLRRVGLANARRDPAGATRLLAEAEARPAAADPSLRSVLQVVRLRLAAKRADDAAVDRLVRDIGHETSARPILIWSPPYEPSAQASARKTPPNSVPLIRYRPDRQIWILCNGSISGFGSSLMARPTTPKSCADRDRRAGQTISSSRYPNADIREVPARIAATVSTGLSGSRCAAPIRCP
ncbi:hypothetical protein QP179_17385 [Sphingomonas aurantiaca]|uniref:hypothetical protein n=1 Tax=Sphingomonas aurantiaca TaxID=185949 RepID=UPI002FE1638A